MTGTATADGVGGGGQRAIEVFADLSCPFTHVGLRRLVDRRQELGRLDIRLHVRAWPLEVVNGKPLDPDFIAEEVDDIRSQVAPDLFDGFRASSFPTSTLPGLALVAAAYERGLATGERVGLELRDLLFERGVDIADREVLRSVAADHDVTFDPTDTSAVLADHDEGVERGVIGSPHFFTADGGFFCPALDVHRDGDGHLHIDPDLAGFEQFAASCFR